jgi:pantetheine-phosphate adenylyltransferase
MALTNRKLAPEIETLFMMPQEEHSYVTASMVRELVRYNQDASQFVTNAVLKHIRAYIERNRK